MLSLTCRGGRARPAGPPKSRHPGRDSASPLEGNGVAARKRIRKGRHSASSPDVRRTRAARPASGTSGAPRRRSRARPSLWPLCRSVGMQHRCAWTRHLHRSRLRLPVGRRIDPTCCATRHARHPSPRRRPQTPIRELYPALPRRVALPRMERVGPADCPFPPRPAPMVPRADR